MNGLPLFPKEGSTFAANTDLLLLLLLGLASVFTLIVVGANLIFIIRYRRRSSSDVPPQISGSNRLEIFWIAVPTLLALGVFFVGARLYLDMATPPANTLDVYVVARQWMWKVQHPDGQEEIDELHVPVGQPVKLIMTSQDVIHSFFVPDFRMKQDVLPGRYTSAWFEATEPGRYRLMCAEFCGTQHAHMLGWITAMDPTAYQDWLATGATQSPASVGARLFQQFACVSCHRDDSLRRAPRLDGLFGQRVRLAGGETLVADESYLRESILNPGAKVVEGFQPIMPSYQGQIDEDQLLDLIIYIKSIGPSTPSQDRAFPVAPATLSPLPSFGPSQAGPSPSAERAGPGLTGAAGSPAATPTPSAGASAP
jgi:cytochrome c oxidase subunit 2